MTDYGPITIEGVAFSATTWPLRSDTGQPARRARDGYLVVCAGGSIYFYDADGNELDLIGYVYLTPDFEDSESEDLPTEADWLAFFAEFEESWER